MHIDKAQEPCELKAFASSIQKIFSPTIERRRVGRRLTNVSCERQRLHFLCMAEREMHLN